MAYGLFRQCFLGQTFPILFTGPFQQADLSTHRVSIPFSSVPLWKFFTFSPGLF